MNACQSTNRLQKLFPEGVREFDTLLNQVFGGSAIRPLASVWRSPLSVWEADNTLHVEVDLPGVKREDVEITFEKGELTITAERKTHTENPVHLHNERTYGKVSRSVTLPDTVDPNTIEAALTDGVLRVSIQKLPEAQPRKIEVR